MKYLIAIVLISVLVFAGCTQQKEDLREDIVIDNDGAQTEDVNENEILSQILDESNDVEIGEMI